MTAVGIDLGTSNTVVCHPRRGVLLDEPSVMVVRGDTRSKRLKPIMVGREARVLVGRCPAGMSIVHPIHDGVIVDLASRRRRGNSRRLCQQDRVLWRIRRSTRPEQPTPLVHKQTKSQGAVAL